MSKPPAYQRYPKDYLSDENVQVMSLAAEGAYNRLMDYCWLQGSIPDDPTKLARLCKTDAKHMAELWAEILPCFEEGPEPGRFVHPRLEEEREKQIAWREKSSKGGKRSAKVRAALRDGSKGGSRGATKGGTKGGSIQKPTTPPRVVQPNGNTAVCSLQREDTDLTSSLSHVAGGEDGEDLDRFRREHTKARELILSELHLGAEEVQRGLHRVGLGLELSRWVRLQDRPDIDCEELNGALTVVRKVGEFPKDEPLTMGILDGEEQEPFLQQCLGEWRKHAPLRSAS